MSPRNESERAELRRYCRRCGYCFAGADSFRCSECGKLFDPQDRRTFDRHPRQRWVRRALRAVGILLLVVALSLVGGILSLLYAWGREQPTADQIRKMGGQVSVER